MEDDTKMKKFKVQFIRSETFTVDVLAESQEQAEELATVKFDEIRSNSMEHYSSETGEPSIEIGDVFDVTNTDDPFNP